MTSPEDPPRRNVSAFAKPPVDRTRGIALVPPATSQTSVAPIAADLSSAETEASVASDPTAWPQDPPAVSSPTRSRHEVSEPPKPDRRRGRPRTTKKEQVASQIDEGAARAGIVLQLTHDVAESLRKACSEENAPYAEWILDAFEDNFDQLTTLYPPMKERQTGLRQRRHRPMKRTGPTDLVQFKLDPEDLVVIDQAWESLHAPSRSDFLARLIAHALGAQQRKK